VIRGVIVHLLNEQPVVVDLLEMPTPGDAGLVCTNVRMLDGRKPIFIDSIDSTFFFPYLNVRFLEILTERGQGAPGGGETSEPVSAAPAAEDEDLEIDEDFLRRIRDA
jgi:hypothetical protein